MPRKPVVHYEGAMYHVMARGIDGRAIFGSDREKSLFYDCLSRIKLAKGFDLFAHAVMPNHFHLVIQVGGSRLSEIMRLVQTRFAVIYNLIHDRQGHVFQGRYKPLPILDNAYLMTVIRYVHLNPVAGGLVALPEKWQWSGHNELLGLAYPGLVNGSVPLGLFGDTVHTARRAYLEFVYAKLADPDMELPEPPDAPDDQIPAPEETPAATRPGIDTLAAGVHPALEWPASSGVRGSSQAARARKDLIRLAFSRGYCVTEIARYLGVSVPYVSKTLSRQKRLRS
jgi:REP element-mobilizing transposase RayT